LIEEKFLANKDCQYSDTLAAIGALRFHINEERVISKDRALAAMHLLLDRPEVADAVIPDLARAEDWSVLPRLVALAKDADEKSYWVRTPVVQYLMACPLPEATVAVKELAEIDPEAVKRASFFVPQLAGPKPVPPALKLAPADEAPPGEANPEPAANAAVAEAEPQAPASKPRARSKAGSAAAASASGAPGGHDQAAAPAASRWIALIPLASGLGLFILLFSILRGGRRLANQVPR
jgi:hypothetical protein